METELLAADYSSSIEEKEDINRKARLMRGQKAKEAVSLRIRLRSRPTSGRRKSRPRSPC